MLVTYMHAIFNKEVSDAMTSSTIISKFSLVSLPQVTSGPTSGVGPLLWSYLRFTCTNNTILYLSICWNRWFGFETISHRIFLFSINEYVHKNAFFQKDLQSKYMIMTIITISLTLTYLYKTFNAVYTFWTLHPLLTLLHHSWHVLVIIDKSFGPDDTP